MKVSTKQVKSYNVELSEEEVSILFQVISLVKTDTVFDYFEDPQSASEAIGFIDRLWNLLADRLGEEQ